LPDVDVNDPEEVVSNKELEAWFENSRTQTNKILALTDRMEQLEKKSKDIVEVVTRQDRRINGFVIHHNDLQKTVSRIESTVEKAKPDGVCLRCNTTFYNGKHECGG
jgi:flagellar motility protein MotE (MotC chaperone)